MLSLFFVGPLFFSQTFGYTQDSHPELQIYGFTLENENHGISTSSLLKYVQKLMERALLFLYKANLLAAAEDHEGPL